MSNGWQVVDSIDRIGPEEWNAVVDAAGGSVFSTHEWLSAYEKTPPAPLHAVRHMAWRENGKLRAVAPMYYASEDPHYTGYGPDYGFDHEILRARMLVGHSFYSYFNGICSTVPAADVAPGLVATMRGVALELGSPLYGFPGVPETDPLCVELDRMGFQPIYTEATSGVDFTGTTEAHLAGLKNKVRREFCRLRRRSERLGATVRTEVNPEYIEAFARLVEDVCTRHGIPTINPPDNIRSIFRHLREQLHFLTIWKDDVLLGGFILLHRGDTLYAWIAGLNYDFHKEYGTYYALYANTLDIAERLGVRRIEMGRSMYGFKVRMGFHPRLLVSWFDATDDAGREVLISGAEALETNCRTRQRIAEAYDAVDVPAPAPLLGAPRFAPRPLARVARS